MTPERLNSWIYRPVHGASTLSLTYEPPLGQSSVVATWTREEVEQSRESSVSHGDEVLTSAKDYMEQLDQREPCKFILSWYGERRADPLRSTPLKLKPESQAPSPLAAALASTASSDNALLVTVIVQLLGSLERRERMDNMQQGIVLAAYERALNMQQKVNDGLSSDNEQMRTLLSSLMDNDKGGELSDVKARALDKLLQALPAVVNMGVQLASSATSTPSPKATREQRMQLARSALNDLDPTEIAELVSTDDTADGATDDASSH